MNALYFSTLVSGAQVQVSLEREGGKPYIWVGRCRSQKSYYCYSVYCVSAVQVFVFESAYKVSNVSNQNVYPSPSFLSLFSRARTLVSSKCCLLGFTAISRLFCQHYCVLHPDLLNPLLCRMVSISPQASLSVR